jgi:alpha-galactosidase
MCIENTAAGTDAEVGLNQQLALQMFSAKLDEEKPVSRLVVVHEDGAGDTKMGRCAAGGPIRLGDKTYTHGIGANSHSVIRVTLAKPAAKFLAVIGLDRNVDNTAASGRFHVAIGGKDALTTDVMKAGAVPKAIDAPLGGANEFELIVDDGGDGRAFDQAGWADAKVVLRDGSEIWLDDLPRNTVVPRLPFSFVFGGKNSLDFIDGWKRQVADEELGQTRSRRTITLTDPATGLEVQAVCTIYLDTPGIDWTVYFTNRGAKDSPIIEQVLALDASVTMAIGSPVTLHRLKGSTSQVDDWMPFDQAVPAGKTEFAATEGRSSNISPWFNLQWDGGGVITTVGWSGQWTVSVELAKGGLRTRAGMQNLHTVLRPGETIRSPRIMQLYWCGSDPWRAYNLFRGTMMAHILPRINGELVLPPIVHLSTSFYEVNASTEKDVFSHLDSLKGLGFEMFWVDAYWTGPNGFPNSQGNYGFPIERVEPKDRFPHGIKAVSDAVGKAGLGYLMWFEPERVAAGTYLSKEHPEWVISPVGDGSGLFNLGIPEARKFMTDYLNAAIAAYKLSCLRIDYNIDPLAYWKFMDAKDPNRAGMAEMRYVEGLYRMWDDILKANPKLFIDNCASGGRRIDLETMSRSIPLWRSDNTCDMLDHRMETVKLAAIKNQLMSAGLNRYMPFSIVGQMGATPYLFRSGFNAGIAFGEDIRPKEYPRELLKQGIAEGKRIRKYFFGDFYALSEVNTSPREWCVTQYHRRQEQDGMVMAFRRDQSSYAGYEAELREIDASADYQVTVYRTYDGDKPAVLKGSALQKLRIEIDERPGSVMIEYKRICPLKTQKDCGRSRMARR